MGYRIKIEVLKDRRRRTEGVNVSQSKILYEENSVYTLKSTRHPSLLIWSRPHSYGRAIGSQNRVRKTENTAEDDNRCKQSQVRDYGAKNKSKGS
jgi:hypothetical protein